VKISGEMTRPRDLKMSKKYLTNSFQLQQMLYALENTHGANQTYEAFLQRDK
jgi:hypothetical protein